MPRTSYVPARQHLLYLALREYLGWTREELADRLAEENGRRLPQESEIRKYELASTAKSPRSRGGVRTWKVPGDPPPMPPRQRLLFDPDDPWLTDEQRLAAAATTEPMWVPEPSAEELMADRPGWVIPAEDVNWDDTRARKPDGTLKRGREDDPVRPQNVGRIGDDYAYARELFDSYDPWVYAVARLAIETPEAAREFHGGRSRGEPLPFELPWPAPVFPSSRAGRDAADELTKQDEGLVVVLMDLGRVQAASPIAVLHVLP